MEPEASPCSEVLQENTAQQQPRTPQGWQSQTLCWAKPPRLGGRMCQEMVHKGVGNALEQRPCLELPQHPVDAHSLGSCTPCPSCHLYHGHSSFVAAQEPPLSPKIPTALPAHTASSPFPGAPQPSPHPELILLQLLWRSSLRHHCIKCCL